jgi:hypothetical protein
MQTRSKQPFQYIVAISFLMDMFERRLIDETDYCVLEAIYAAKFMPLFRYEKPCENATLPITQTGQDGAHSDPPS